MRKSIAFSSRHLNHKRIAQRLFDELNVQQFGFAPVRKELMKMGIELEDINKIIDEIKKLVK